MEPMDRDVRPVMTRWGVPVQPIVTINGRMLYGLQPKQEECFHHTPLSERWREHGSPTNIGYGGAAGGAKSHTARAILARVAFQWPGSTSIIFRKTLPELEANHIQKYQEEMPRELWNYNGRFRVQTWPNGSKTYFGYLRNDDDKFNYQGPEYDCMVFEESTHYEEKTVNWLTSNRLRATVPDSIPFALYPSNPGNVGHFWYSRLFIDRRFNADREEEPGDYAFIQAHLEDNKILMARDPGYIKKLNKLPEPWRSWMRDGDFSAGAGLFFVELDRRVHLVEPFDVPAHWPLFAGFDWGYNHPWSMGIFAANEDGTIYKVETFTGRRQNHTQILESIFDQAAAAGIDMNRVNYIACGHDVFSRRGRELGYDGPTLGEKMIEEGLVPIEANQGRIYGASNLRDYFHWRRDQEAAERGELVVDLPPALRYMRTPKNLQAWEQMETRVADENNIEDVQKTDADEFGEGGDDHYDADRYALASRPQRAISIGMDREISAWDPEVLEHEADTLRRVRDTPLKRRGGRPSLI